MTARLVIVGVVALLVTACGTTDGAAVSSEAATAPSASSSATTASGAPSTAASGPSACSDRGGRVGADRVCAVHTEAPGYTIDMKFPTDHPDQRALAEALTQQRDQFVATNTEPPISPMPKALDITSTTYRSGSPESGTASVVLQKYVNVGGAHPEPYYDALNYDSVIFFIGQGMWTIEAAGAQEVSVPRTALASVLA